MPAKIIDGVSERLKKSEIDINEKEELMGLLASLKGEVSELSLDNFGNAQSIAAFTQIAAHEVLKEEVNPELKEIAISGLRASVKEFEVTHPKLARIVNSISMMFSNIGI